MNNSAYSNDASDPFTVEMSDDFKSNGYFDKNGNIQIIDSLESMDSIPTNKNDNEPERENWGKSIEFLMSCIAMSVGLGNVWRFPFTALENGGGAFLLPYIVVLFIIGRPLYYLEMVLGQFSSRNSINVFDMAPFFRGNVSLYTIKY